MGRKKEAQAEKPGSAAKRRKRGDEPTAAEHTQAAQLEEDLFGGELGVLGALEAAGAGDAEGGLSVAALIRNAAAAGKGRSGKGAKQPVHSKAPEGAAEAPRPAWEDEDDAAVVVAVASKSRLRKLRQTEEESELAGDAYVDRLRAEHAKLNPRTGWAKLSGKRAPRATVDDSEDEGEEDGGRDLLQQTGALVRQTGGGAAAGLALPAGELMATRVRDANIADPSKAVVRSVAFHPTAPLLLTAGMDRSLRLFQVDGNRNPKVQGVFLEDMPIYRAAFSGSGEQVIATGRRPHYYVYHLGAGRVERVAGIVGCADRSLESFVESPPGVSPPLVAFLGNDGVVPLVSMASRSCIGQLKMNGTTRAAAFTDDGRMLLTAGGDGQVYTWDLRTHRCLERMVDDGALNVTALALSPGGGFLASGGNAGVVNIYKRQEPLIGAAAASAPVPPTRPPPVRSLMNLTTVVDTMSFSPDGQMLAFASRMKKDSLRVMHLPSCTVFSNWPSGKTPLHYVHSLAFSPNCGFMAVGNARGRVLLYRLHHYDRL